MTTMPPAFRMPASTVIFDAPCPQCGRACRWTERLVNPGCEQQTRIVVDCDGCNEPEVA